MDWTLEEIEIAARVMGESMSWPTGFDKSIARVLAREAAKAVERHRSEVARKRSIRELVRDYQQ